MCVFVRTFTSSYLCQQHVVAARKYITFHCKCGMWNVAWKLMDQTKFQALHGGLKCASLLQQMLQQRRHYIRKIFAACKMMCFCKCFDFGEWRIEQTTGIKITQNYRSKGYAHMLFCCIANKFLAAFASHIFDKRPKKASRIGLKQSGWNRQRISKMMNQSLLYELSQ